MKVTDIWNAREKPTISFELFPARSEKAAKGLDQTITELSALSPDFISVTFGAGGSTQQGTYDTIMDIQQAGYAAAPHLSCIGSTRDNIRIILQKYLKKGIKAEDYASDAVRKNEDMSWEEWAKRFNKYLKYLEKLFYPDLFIIGGGISKKIHKYSDYLEIRIINNAHWNLTTPSLYKQIIRRREGVTSHL